MTIRQFFDPGAVYLSSRLHKALDPAPPGLNRKTVAKRRKRSFLHDAPMERMNRSSRKPLSDT
jgi:hypothetical protein